VTSSIGIEAILKGLSAQLRAAERNTSVDAAHQKHVLVVRQSLRFT
jgi:hypothetical protein